MWRVCFSNTRIAYDQWNATYTSANIWTGHTSVSICRYPVKVFFFSLYLPISLHFHSNTAFENNECFFSSSFVSPMKNTLLRATLRTFLVYGFPIRIALAGENEDHVRWWCRRQRQKTSIYSKTKKNESGRDPLIYLRMAKVSCGKLKTTLKHSADVRWRTIRRCGRN